MACTLLVAHCSAPFSCSSQSTLLCPATEHGADVCPVLHSNASCSRVSAVQVNIARACLAKRLAKHASSDCGATLHVTGSRNRSVALNVARVHADGARTMSDRVWRVLPAPWRTAPPCALCSSYGVTGHPQHAEVSGRHVCRSTARGPAWPGGWPRTPAPWTTAPPCASCATRCGPCGPTPCWSARAPTPWTRPGFACLLPVTCATRPARAFPAARKACQAAPASSACGPWVRSAAHQARCAGQSGRQHHGPGQVPHLLPSPFGAAAHANVVCMAVICPCYQPQLEGSLGHSASVSTAHQAATQPGQRGRQHPEPGLFYPLPGASEQTAPLGQTSVDWSTSH